MSDRKTLKLRAASADPQDDPRQSWAVSRPRLDRLRDLARDMRRHPTDAERLLWTKLNNQQLGGFKFRRQQVVGSAIVDFACPARWLVVDIDDATANAEVSSLRDRKLTEVGIRVLRFTEEAVADDVDGVSQAILAELQKPFEKPRVRGAGQ